MAIILVVIMAVGLYLNKIQRQELLSEETSIISSYAEEKERKVDALVQLQRQMLDNSIVRQYVANAYKSKEETAYTRREVNTYLSELYDNFYYREEIEDIFVYFDKTDIAISGVYGSLELTDYAKTHILQNYNSTDVEIAAIRDNIIIEEKGRPRFFVYSNGGKECIGISMRYYSVQERWMSNCCAVILLGTGFFDGYAGEITSDSKVGIAIDSYPYILFSSEDNIEWTPEKQDFQKVQIIDKNRARLEKSERYPFTYVLMNNHNEYSWELYRFSVILYLIVLFLCFLFVYISIQVANYIYRPIELLLSGLTDKLQTGDYRNINSKYDEFFVLNNVLKKYDNTLYELEKEKSYTKEQLKGIYLTKFMLGTFTEDEKEKIVKLLTPAFNKSLNNPGYIMNYPKGIRENGGQYTHSVSWYLIALIKAGYHDRAYRYYQMINPINRSKKEENVKCYRDEPYVIAADIYSSPDFPARGGWTWYTGSAGWFYRVGIENILGIQRHGDKLKLDPRIPIAWDGFKATYTYKDTKYNIEVKKGKKEELKLDGKSQINNYIKLENDSKNHEIKLTIK